MIIKSMSRKRPECGELIAYLLQPEKTTPDEHVSQDPLFRNFPAESPTTMSALQKVFEGNAKQIPRRKNGVYYYHEILSFAAADTPILTKNPKIIGDLAHHYLEQRAPESLTLGVVHHDRDHLHIHLLISANAVGRTKKLRLSKHDFQTIKRETEAYQRTAYPQLTSSIAQNNPMERIRNTAKSPAKPTLPANTPVKPSKNTTKTHLQTVLRQAFTLCSHQGLEAFLKTHQITLYTRKRAKIPTGVVYQGKKYRFSTLGLEKEFRKTRDGWQRLPAFLTVLKTQWAEALRQEWRRETGYHQEIAEVLHPQNQPTETAHIHKMLKTKRHARRSEYLDSSRGHRPDLPER